MSAAPQLRPVREGDRKPLVIGLVNCMPDSALKSTERQFESILTASATDVPVEMRLFSIPEVPRTPAGMSHINAHYQPIKRLWSTHIDGLIVTGTEPRSESLNSEPFWQTLTTLIEWAEQSTVASIWSCLAAHAVALHLDGIRRQRAARKLVGVFECRKACEHPVLEGLGSEWVVPHSRYNGLPEGELRTAGYRVLSRSERTGPDMCAKERKSLFILMQGHPEYGPESLFREYRRDVGRYLAGERNDYPDMPENYFGPDLAARFEEFRELASREQNPELISRFPAAEEAISSGHSWRRVSHAIYSNWLRFIDEQAGKSRWRTAAQL
jgi:homoserine O-succinyltransferase/O-acetyltransferase